MRLKAMLIVRRVFIFVASFFLFTFVVACAPTTQRVSVSESEVAREAELQRQYALRQQIKYQARLDRISYPILKSAVLHCEGETRNRIGINISNAYVWDKEYRKAAMSELNVGEHISIIGVTPGSAAERAGLRVNDIILKVDETPTASGKGAVKSTQKLLDKASEDNLISFMIRREQESSVIELSPDEICYYPVLLSESDAVNAYADGDNIVITKGMMRFTESDQELALVIGHELAHNTMGHIDAKTGNFLLGSILDVAAAAYGVNTQNAFGKMAAGAFSQDFEAEADYVGLYYLQWAGYELDGAADFWRRMAAEKPGSIGDSYAATHPSTSRRFVEIEETEEEINAKLHNSAPLLPNLKSHDSTVDSEGPSGEHTQAAVSQTEETSQFEQQVEEISESMMCNESRNMLLRVGDKETWELNCGDGEKLKIECAVDTCYIKS